MYGSPPLPPSKDLNLPHQPTGPYSGGREEEAESDLLRRRRQQQQQQQMSSSLLRYRSAPSTLLGEVCEDFIPVRASTLESETVFARFLAPDLRDEPPGGATATLGHRSPRFLPPPPSTSAQEGSEQQNGVYSSAQQMVFCPQQQMPNHSSAESPFRAAIGSSAMEREQLKNGDFGNSCSLLRHSSSPAGLFSHLNVGDGYGMMRGMDGFRNGSGFMMDAANRSKGQISFSSRQNSIMSQISETGSEDNDGSSPKDGSGGDGRTYITGLPVASWDDSPPFDNRFSGGLKRSREDEKMVAGLGSLDPQNGEMKNHASGLSHQFSLPKTSSEIATIEKFLQFHDAVPCKIRAKRGCATHPRSIAERVRRTRISERMKKLQELVPNMDKQTNTADMLDLAVDYIKDLQKQVKALSESRASCSCSANRQKQF